MEIQVVIVPQVHSLTEVHVQKLLIVRRFQTALKMDQFANALKDLIKLMEHVSVMGFLSETISVISAHRNQTVNGQVIFVNVLMDMFRFWVNVNLKISAQILMEQKYKIKPVYVLLEHTSTCTNKNVFFVQMDV